MSSSAGRSAGTAATSRRATDGLDLNAFGLSGTQAIHLVAGFAKCTIT
jgi:hypothetical protein